MWHWIDGPVLKMCLSVCANQGKKSTWQAALDWSVCGIKSGLWQRSGTLWEVSMNSSVSHECGCSGCVPVTFKCCVVHGLQHKSNSKRRYLTWLHGRNWDVIWGGKTLKSSDSGLYFALGSWRVVPVETDAAVIDPKGGKNLERIRKKIRNQWKFEMYINVYSICNWIHIES